MNRRRRGSGLKFVAPPGPLASAPVASAANQNMWYQSTDFGLCKYVSVFNNEGSDWIDCGRPSWLSQMVPGVNSYSFGAVFSITTLGEWAIVGGMTQFGPSRQMYIGSYATGQLVVYVGGAMYNVPSFTAVVGRYYYCNVVVTTTNATVFVDGVAKGSFTIGTDVYPTNLRIGSRSDGSLNLEGAVAKVTFGGLDTLCLNKWDGSSTVYFDSGITGIVTDGAPFTAKSYACIPWSVLQC